MHSGSGLVHTLQKMDHLLPSISLLLQLGVPTYPTRELIKEFFFHEAYCENKIKVRCT